MMIVELSGLPGSGKSYLISRLKGTKDTGFYSDNTIKSNIIRFIKKMCVFLPSSLILRSRIKKIIGKKRNSVYINIDIDNHIDQLLMLAYGYKYLHNIYVDEGIVHRIVSMAVNYSLSMDEFNKIIQLFMLYLRNVKVYYIKMDIKNCIKYIKIRDRHNCLMDELDEDTLITFLKEYSKYYIFLMKNYNIITINRDDINRIIEGDKNDCFRNITLSGNN